MTISVVGALTSTVHADMLVIKNNPGGVIVSFLNDVKVARDNKVKVFIQGYCNSACTLYLSLPREQLCINEGVEFGFHQASVDLFLLEELYQRFPFFKDMEDLMAESMTMKMLSMYPDWVSSWIDESGGMAEDLKVMPYSYASRFVQTCL